MKRLKTRNLNDSLKRMLNGASISGAIWRCHEIAALSGLTLKRSVLDLGCGDGRFTKIMFAKKLDFGLDKAATEIEKAKQKGTHLNYIVADAHRIPLPSHSIETVFSNSVVEHIPNLGLVLQEISRILKPGGEFIFTTHAPSSKKFFGVYLLNKIGLKFLAQLYEKVFVHQLQLRTLWSLNRWKKELAKVGIRIDEFELITPPRSAFWYEFFMPPTLLQNRLTFLKKLPFAKIVFFLLRPDLNSTKDGRNFFIRARKL